jgi:hypothetical protein
MLDEPEVRVIEPTFGDKGFLVECLDLECGFNDLTGTKDEADEMKRTHEEWHRDGCPE